MFDMLLSGAGTMAMGAIAALLVKNVPPPLQFESSEPPGDVYDFIVVGAGCAGSVVASRLSETGARVLLLEAGDDVQRVSLVPSVGVNFLTNDHTWDVRAKSQPDAMLSFVNNSSWMKQGKSMGGSSMYNGMMYARGGRQDFDQWARLGNTGWDYDSLLPYFKKFETFDTDVPTLATDRYRGRSGPIHVNIRPPANKMTEVFLKAGQELGYDVLDINGERSIGFSTTQMTTKNGMREVASQNFLKLAKDRPNLTVRPKVTVIRVLFNRKKRAIGVEYEFGGQKRVVRSRKEVILSAGAVKTPHILLLSGVGPITQLQRFGIPIVAAVEGVGQNLQDHPVTLLPPWVIKDGSSITIQQLLDPKQIGQYVKNTSGILQYAIGEEAVAFLNLNGDDPEWCDVWLQLTSSPAFGASVTLQGLGMKPEIIDAVVQHLGEREGMGMTSLLARPKSRGSVTLRSADYRDLPEVDNNIFGHLDDLELSVKGIRAVHRLLDTRVMKTELNPQAPVQPLEACQHHRSDSDSYWRCYSRHNTYGGYHLSSTSKMAPSSDPLGVVSPRLRVRGVRGVRVIDVSIQPEIVTANTMAVAYMIGEKGADLVKEDWGYAIDHIS